MKTVVAILLLCLLLFARYLKIPSSLFLTLILIVLPIGLQLLWYPRAYRVDVRPYIGSYAIFFFSGCLVKIMVALSVFKVEPSKSDIGLTIAFAVSGILLVGCTIFHIWQRQRDQTVRLAPPTIRDCLSQQEHHR